MWAFQSEGGVGAAVIHLELRGGRRRRGGQKAWRREFRMLSRSVGKVRQVWARVIRGCLALTMGLWWTEVRLGEVFEIAARPFHFHLP